jgi:hypothetical protein
MFPGRIVIWAEVGGVEVCKLVCPDALPGAGGVLDLKCVFAFWFPVLAN